jgi:protein dithiol:quinone oxidoreductase
MSPRALLAALALVCTGAVATAVALQYTFGMQPCPWCILQRVIYLAVALTAVLGLLWRSRAGLFVSATLVALLAACGMAAALWQHFVASSAASCDLTLAERVVSALRLDEHWPQVFTAYASCKDAVVKLLGVAFELWSLALFALVLLVAIRVLRRAAKGAPVRWPR